MEEQEDIAVFDRSVSGDDAQWYYPGRFARGDRSFEYFILPLFCLSALVAGRLLFDGKGMQLFGKHIIWWLLSLITSGIYSFWIPCILKWETKHTELTEKSKVVF